jgi:hypothetical protein
MAIYPPCNQGRSSCDSSAPYRNGGLERHRSIGWFGVRLLRNLSRNNGESVALVARCMIVQSYDEVDFTVRPSDSPAFMHVGLSESGDAASDFAVIGSGQLDLVVTLEDARRLAGRLVAAVDQIASEQLPCP